MWSVRMLTALDISLRFGFFVVRTRTCDSETRRNVVSDAKQHTRARFLAFLQLCDSLDIYAAFGVLRRPAV